MNDGFGACIKTCLICAYSFIRRLNRACPNCAVEIIRPGEKAQLLERGRVQYWNPKTKSLQFSPLKLLKQEERKCPSSAFTTK